MARILKLTPVAVVFMAALAAPEHTCAETSVPEKLRPLLLAHYSPQAEPREWLYNYLGLVPGDLLSSGTRSLLEDSVADKRLSFLVVTNQPRFPAGEFDSSTGIVRLNEKYLASSDLADRLQILISLTHELTHAVPFRQDPNFYAKTMEKFRTMSNGDRSVFEFLELVFIFDSEMQAYGGEVMSAVWMRDWFKKNGGWLPQKILDYQSFGVGPLPPWRGPHTTVSILDHPDLLPLLAYRAVVEMRDYGQISTLDRALLVRLLFSRYPHLVKWHVSTYGQVPG